MKPIPRVYVDQARIFFIDTKDYTLKTYRLHTVIGLIENHVCLIPDWYTDQSPLLSRLHLISRRVIMCMRIIQEVADRPHEQRTNNNYQ